MTSDFSVAVHAIVFLNHKGRLVPSDELAVNICTNPVRVRKIMARLKKDGLVETKEGSVGGYRFRGDADKLTLAQIARCMEVQFVSANWRSGSDDMECLIASNMGRVMDGVFKNLNLCCMDYLNNITISMIEGQIFQKKADKIKEKSL